MPAHGSWGRCLILYRALDDRVEIVRVVHGARSIEQIDF
jgi:plasmid stabilization system protein ParE